MIARRVADIMFQIRNELLPVFFVFNPRKLQHMHKNEIIVFPMEITYKNKSKSLFIVSRKKKTNLLKAIFKKRMRSDENTKGYNIPVPKRARKNGNSYFVFGVNSALVFAKIPLWLVKAAPAKPRPVVSPKMGKRWAG